MVIEKYLETTEYGDKYILICEKCNKILAEIHYAGSQYQFIAKGSCQHYKWAVVGNACYENTVSEVCRGTEKLVEKAVKAYYDGTSVYLLLPR